MTYMPDDEETWARATNNRPLKLGDNIYFVKVRQARGKQVVYIPMLAMSEQGLLAGNTYTVRMKAIKGGKVYNLVTELKNAVISSESNRWPLYGVLPSDCGLNTGAKLYARFEAVDLVKWFESDTEIGPEDMGKE